jgi:cystathionine gamma-synthase
VVGGAVIAAEAADFETLSTWANITGCVGAPFDAYLTLRGVRTLFPRIERQQQTAAAVAAFLDQHPAVAAVHYPGLASDPGHAIASSQQSGFGAMLSFDLAGGVREVRTFVEALSLITLAESLGGIESLIAHPATMTHLGMGAEARRIAGIGDSLLRLTIGLEDERDLVDDLDCAFQSLGAAAS